VKTGLISDIHEDLSGLVRSLEQLRKSGCSEIICLGDIAGYSSPHFRFSRTRNASECMRVIREKCSLVIPGNHDLFACRKVPASNPGFDYPPGWYELDFTTREELGDNRIWLYEDTEAPNNLSEEDKRYLSGLPEYRIIKRNDLKILLSHHLYPDLTGSSTRLLPDPELERSHLNFMDNSGIDISFFGHNHVEGLWLISGEGACFMDKIDINKYEGPIAVGLPCIANGRNTPGYAVMDIESGIIESYRLYKYRTRFLNL
jgi:predicted phosphodiesterase